MLAIAVAVSNGGYALGDRPCAQGSVLYAAIEDTGRRLRSRLEKLCGIRAWIDERPDARLVIVNTLAKVRSGPQGRETAYQADYREVGSLKGLADETGVAIVVVTHTRKMGTDDPFATVSGRLGITGAADATMIITRDGQGVTLVATGRDVAEIETAQSGRRIPVAGPC